MHLPKLSARLFVIGGAYLLLLCLGVFAVIHRSTGPRTKRGFWAAAVDLPRHHQIRVVDLVDSAAGGNVPDKRPVLGQHLLRGKKKGDTIAVSDVAPEPLIGDAPAKGGVRFVYRPAAGEDGISRLLRSGSRVIPCSWNDAGSPAEKALRCDRKTMFEVVVAHYPSTASDSAWILLEADSTPHVGDFLSATHRALLLP